MKLKFLISTAAAFLLGAAMVQAADISSTTATNSLTRPKFNWLDPNNDSLYRNWELNLEAFGYGSVSERTIDNATGHRFYRQNHLGAGAGLEFFFCKYVGVEGEAFSGSTSHSFVDDFGGNLVLRYPIGTSGFAPYVFGGGGHECDPVPGAYWDGGVGLEFRFTKWFGIFADARYMATDKIGNFGMGRAGVKFTF